MSYWKDKVVVITGGSAGLGRALGAAYSAAGAKVVLVARDLARLEATAEELRSAGGEVMPLSADITRDEDAARMVAETLARHGRLDVLVNNAGRSGRGTLLTTPLDEFRQLWELNFLALVRCTQAAAEPIRQGRGHIVNIGSLAAKGASRFLGAYPSSKFPVAAFSQQLRLELADDGVHVLLVCPGPLQRADAGTRYEVDENLPESARRPGGGVKLKGIPPERLAQQVLRACERRQLELVVPGRARLLFGISQWWPALGDWIVTKMT